MAYGKNQDRKRWRMRAIPLGVGTLSPAKKARLLDLRNAILILMRQMAEAGFAPEPLDAAWQGKALDERLLAIQRACATLNSVWREQARMRVKPALEEGVRRYYARLAGGLRFVDARIPEPDGRLYFQVPEAVQDTITAAELAELKAYGSRGQALDLFRRWRAGDHGLTPSQAAVLADIHARALQKHTPPDFGRREDFTLQLHLDPRMLPAKDKDSAVRLRAGAGRLLADDANARYFRFVDLAGALPRAPRIRIPLALTRNLARRLDGASHEWAALIVELSATTVGVRLVAGKPPMVMPAFVSAFVGRDFGYANTVSLSVATTDAACSLDAIRTDLERLDSQEAVRDFLARHTTGDARIIARVRFDGRAFLKRIHTLCARIDGYKSRIDLAYNRLAGLRQAIAGALGLEAGQRLMPEVKRQHPQAREFFACLGLIQDLKRARRALYGKIVALKKNWFGLLSNVEIGLARKYQAAIVRENLTVLAVEKAAPEYKGRLFNKMLNNGSKGQYQKRATDKMLWNGVPELVVPSWYTSRACLAHSVIVDKKHRKGERIHLPCCGIDDHADEHAADTIACYPLLQPRNDAAPLARHYVTPAIPGFALGSSGL